jgi:molybdate transport system substrate-binding protein
VNGAPADVFISADTVQMDYAQRAGAIDPSTRRDVVANRLAVIVPRDARVPIQGPRDLASPAVRRIAIGDPAAVPAGQYARQYLERAGLWATLQSKLLPLANVRAALAAAQSGGVDAAIVYESDAAGSDDVALAYLVPDAEAPRIVYPAAIVARSANRADAERFLTYLQSARAREILERYRFRPLAERTR